MSLPERSRVLAAAIVLPMVLVSACTVRPLYSDAGYAAGGVATIANPSIAVKPVETRYAQQVRNNLIFDLYGGANQPAAARYTLDLGITVLNEPSALVQIGTEDEPTAATITMISSYVLTETATGKPMARGRRQVMSSYDVPRQQYAAWRAEINAQDRAARELAHAVRLAIAQDLVAAGQ